MTKVLLYLLAFAGALNAINAQFYINDVLLRLRQEYIAYKWNCLLTLDITYSRIYSTLNTTLFQIIEPYLMQNSLLWACQNFQTSKLNRSTASRLKNTCNVITSTYALSIPTVHNCMMSFYSGLLGSSSESQNTGQEVFLTVEDSMNALVPMYIAKPVCVGSLLRSFVGTYKNVTDNISNINQRTINNVARIFTNATTASRLASNTINGLRNNLVSCNSSREADSCIRKMLKDYIDCGRNCLTAYETLSDPLREIHDLMADFNNFYAAEQSKATEYACTVGEALADWIEKAEGCLVLPNDTPVNFMPSTMRPSATLATTSSSATTTRPARG